MKEVLGTLLRLGGFAVVFVALLAGGALLAGEAVGGMAILGVLSLLAALGASVLVLRCDGRRSLRELGLDGAGALRGSGGGFLLGVVIMVPVLLLAVGAGGLRYGSDQGTALEYLSTGPGPSSCFSVPPRRRNCCFAATRCAF